MDGKTDVFYYSLVFAAYLEKLQDDSTQLREAREALDALRHEHAEQRRLEEEEANRQRQMQMMQKVEVLRQQKRVGSHVWLSVVRILIQST